MVKKTIFAYEPETRAGKINWMIRPIFFTQDLPFWRKKQKLVAEAKEKYQRNIHFTQKR